LDGGTLNGVAVVLLSTGSAAAGVVVVAVTVDLDGAVGSVAMGFVDALGRPVAAVVGLGLGATRARLVAAAELEVTLVDALDVCGDAGDPGEVLRAAVVGRSVVSVDSSSAVVGELTVVDFTVVSVSEVRLVVVVALVVSVVASVRASVGVSDRAAVVVRALTDRGATGGGAAVVVRALTDRGATGGGAAVVVRVLTDRGTTDRAAAASP